VVLAAVAVWVPPGDVLARELASPAWVAARVFVPAVLGVRLQLPAATLPVHVSVPSLTVTFPVGVPPPDVTVNVTAIASPMADGFGVSPVVVVVVVAAVTGYVSPTAVLPAR